MRLKKYVSSKNELVPFKNKIKLVPCPHCKKTGLLILHGPLKGACLTEEGKDLDKGHRFFCNNRKKRRGCGRTFSLSISYVLKYLQTSTNCLWKFLNSIINGKPKNTVFKESHFPFSIGCGNHWLNQLKKYQYKIRNLLLKKSLPPETKTRNPLIQLLQHIKTAFSAEKCPLAAYQEYFQTPFLRD